MYAKDEDAEIDNLRTYHKNDEEETEVEKEDIVEGQWVSLWGQWLSLWGQWVSLWGVEGVKCGGKNRVLLIMKKAYCFDSKSF